MDLPFLFNYFLFFSFWFLVSILILMDLPFLSRVYEIRELRKECFNPYSNGSSFFMLHSTQVICLVTVVSILILMDLPFLLRTLIYQNGIHLGSFNPYSNGSSFFIQLSKLRNLYQYTSFNPYSNGSSFFIGNFTTLDLVIT